MDNPVAATELYCTQCGGELHPEESQIFLTCPYCSAAIYLDKSKVVFHWYLAPTLDETKASAALARWMAGNQTVKNLDQKSRITSSSFEYFPIWYFKRRQKDDQEEILLEPAAATSVSEVRRLKLPAGDLRKYEPSLDSQSRSPSVPLEAALSWLAERQVSQAEIAEQALVHIPIYTYKYTYQNNSYTALVEAGTGEVLANIYPAKAEAPYQTIGCLTALVFLILALIPLISSQVNGGSGLGVGLLICTGLAVVAAPILFAISAWVAAKI